MKENFKKYFKILFLVLCMILSTGVAATSVFAATQNSLQTVTNISFNADSYVDAIITESTNVFEFKSDKLADDNQTGTFSSIENSDWVDNLDTDSDIDKKVEKVITIKNTSIVESNIIEYNITNDFNLTYAECIINDASGELKAGESRDIIITFITDGLHDIVTTDINWTISLISK